MTNLCECGCGTEVKNRFAFNHHTRLSGVDYIVDENGCWIWQRGKVNSGYGFGILNGKRGLAHRNAYESEHGPIPEGMQVCHSCDVKLCVNPDHLWLGTNRDNVQDMMRKGRHVVGPRLSGEEHLNSKLTWEAVRKIRSRPGVIGEFAKEFGVNRSTIDRVQAGTTWIESNH